MPRKILFQTVEDRDNPDAVLRDAPFKCDIARDPWLGEGYYFWDTFIELAHWWGWKGYFGRYMILQKIIDYSYDDYFDLVGNTDHIRVLERCSTILSKEFGQKNPTVAKVIEYLKGNPKLSFNFKAIRAEGRGSIMYSEELDLKRRLFYKKGKSAYLDLRPAIQICYFKKQDLVGPPLTIVYPDEYVEFI